MKATTSIEWTEHTWNPFVGCTLHTAGCTNCYAMKMAARIVSMNNSPTYDGTVETVNGKPVWTGVLKRGSDKTWKKPYEVLMPARVFVNSMSDFFHESAPDEWRIEALKVMTETWHQYQILTKRPENIEPFLHRWGKPLPNNVWIGATVERSDFKARIDVLRRVSANIRFLSLEPLLDDLGELDLRGIDWVIAGGESGFGARPMKAEWVIKIRDQCVREEIPFFFKQWGVPQNNPLWWHAMKHLMQPAGEYLTGMDPIGKGGSMIDGQRWTQWPDWKAEG